MLFFVSKIKVAHVVLITRLPAYTEKLFFVLKIKSWKADFLFQSLKLRISVQSVRYKQSRHQ